MIYPTISELTKDEFNRYELTLATAKCARIITNEYVRQREEAERSTNGNKEAERNILNMIDKEYRDEKAVKCAISRIYNGQYTIVRVSDEEPVAEVSEEEAADAE